MSEGHFGAKKVSCCNMEKKLFSDEEVFEQIKPRVQADCPRSADAEDGVQEEEINSTLDSAIFSV